MLLKKIMLGHPPLEADSLHFSKYTTTIFVREKVDHCVIET